MQDLIAAFPDEDQHLLKFSQWRPKAMTVKELLSILKCPPTVESGERGRESESKRAWRTRRARQTETERETERVREREGKIGRG